MPSNHLATNLFAAQENYSNVLQHQMSGDLKPVVCLDCGLAFNGMAEREEHRKQMHPMKGYLCNDCGEQFVSEAELVDHVSSVHFDSYETKSEMFPCKMCERTYTTRAALQLHNCPARKPMTFICAICNKGFQYKSQLTSHMRTHSGERPFGCDQCGKKFAATLNLVQHLRTHTGERPFACDKCSKTFTQRSHLLTHLRTHTGEKPFKCGYCAKAYKNRLDLRIHCNNKHGVDIRVREANHPNSAKRGFLAWIVFMNISFFYIFNKSLWKPFLYDPALLLWIVALAWFHVDKVYPENLNNQRLRYTMLPGSDHFLRLG